MRPVLTILALFLMVGCSTIPIQEQSVFMPKASVTPESFDVEGVTLNNEYIQVDDSVALNAWYLTQPESEGTVLFFGGNGFYLVQSLGYIRALTRPPLDAFMYDYRGYGQSEGSPGVDVLKRDALALYDSLTAREDIDPERLIVHGHSLGAFLATYVAEQRTVGGLVLENPATNVDEWVQNLAPWYVRLFVSFEVDPALRDESNLRRLQNLDDVPLLVVGGASDQVTAPVMARTLHEETTTAPKELVIVEDGGHNKLYTRASYRAAYDRLVERVTNRGAELSARTD